LIDELYLNAKTLRDALLKITEACGALPEGKEIEPNANKLGNI
jgi:hypothetical protein